MVLVERVVKRDKKVLKKCWCLDIDDDGDGREGKGRGARGSEHVASGHSLGRSNTDTEYPKNFIPGSAV